jgi:hypothetical protein
LIEVKFSENKPSPHLVYFKERNPGAKAVQLVRTLRQEENLKGVSVVPAARWLADLPA